MAITSVGYDGQIGESEWAIMAPRIGLPYWVADIDALAPTIVTNADRTLEIAGGIFGGAGVMDTSSGPTRFTFDSVTKGRRYDLVVARRNWQGTGGTTSFEVIKGSSSRRIPTFNRAPGTLDDQLIALVSVVAGSTRIESVTDLRGFGLNSKVMLLDPLGMQGYANWPGLQAQIGREEYTLQVDRTWVRTGLISATTPRYRLRVYRYHKMKSTNTSAAVTGGWTTAGDNTMGLQLLSNGSIKVKKAGLYSISYSISRYNSPIKVTEASVTLRIDGIWTKPEFEEHRNANWQGVESSLFWQGILNDGDVIVPRAGQWNAGKRTLEYKVEMQIEMVG